MHTIGPAATTDTLRGKTYRIIFGQESGWARSFDVVLIALILLSVIVVMIDSVERYRINYATELQAIEWAFTALFTLEYLARVWCVRSVRTYAFSFFGIVDLLAILPTYLSIFLPGGQFLVTIRILRVVRIFRVFKLVRFLGEASVLSTALRNSRYKITVFLVTVVCIVIVVGSLMYLIEGDRAGFTSIPRSMYWAVVTLTTVGYGDIIPLTTVGQSLAAVLMIVGYGIIAVPTGIITAEMAQIPGRGNDQGWSCQGCAHIETDPEAHFCRLCSARRPGDN